MFAVSVGQTLPGNLSSDVFELRESTENVFFAFLNRGIEQFFGQIFSRRVKALSNTNLIASRHIKRENASL